MDQYGRGITSGRKKKRAGGEFPENSGNGKACRKRRAFSESVFFTLGLAFVILYFAGLLATSGSSLKYDAAGAVAAMAETEEAKQDKSLWDLLDECLADVFKERGAEN